MVQTEKYRCVLPVFIQSAAGFFLSSVVSVLSFQTTFDTHRENFSYVSVSFLKVTVLLYILVPLLIQFLKQVYYSFLNVL